VAEKVKWPWVRNSGRWLAGDHGALTTTLRREIARGEMKCEMAWGDRPGYI
jgi:hypothetical protein